MAFVLSITALRATLPNYTTAILSNFIIVCPFVLVAAFLIAQRSRDARFAVTLGNDLTDAWHYVLVMNVLVVGRGTG